MHLFCGPQLANKRFYSGLACASFPKAWAWTAQKQTWVLQAAVLQGHWLSAVEGPCPPCSSRLVLCALSFSSLGLILCTRKNIENKPFNLLMYFSFYCLPLSVFKPLACSVLTSCNWEQDLWLAHLLHLLPVVVQLLCVETTQTVLENSKLQITTSTFQCS